MPSIYATPAALLAVDYVCAGQGGQVGRVPKALEVFQDSYEQGGIWCAASGLAVRGGGSTPVSQRATHETLSFRWSTAHCPPTYGRTVGCKDGEVIQPPNHRLEAAPLAPA